ncbi:unnamed protein product [Strongylus vulgaris]|uniref:Uncharacterized protein n=1 Tax=Strongylus vulgaris TaxID=40348 RepID=A0A3P7JI84_STRVU|nr:unnamed protein product [Strongylus vulgaris]
MFYRVGGYHGDTMVKCLTTHLSVFSVGLFDANVDTDFTYEYIADHREEHIAATMIVIVMTVHMLIVMLFAINYEMIEGDKEHIAATMIVIVMTVHMLIVMLFAINYEMIEGDKVNQQLSGQCSFFSNLRFVKVAVPIPFLDSTLLQFQWAALRDKNGNSAKGTVFLLQ